MICTFPQPPALVDNRDVFALIAEVLRAVRAVESDGFNFTRNGFLKRSIREDQERWQCLRLLDRELQFAPRDAFFDLVRDAVHRGLNYIDGIGTPQCPMPFVRVIEREICNV